MEEGFFFFFLKEIHDDVYSHLSREIYSIIKCFILLYFNILVLELSVNEEMNFIVVGVEHVGGDMFVSVPSGDAIFMKVSLFCDFQISH